MGYPRPYDEWIDAKNMNCPLRIAEFNTREQAETEKNYKKIQKSLIISQNIAAQVIKKHQDKVNNALQTLCNRMAIVESRPSPPSPPSQRLPLTKPARSGIHACPICKKVLSRSDALKTHIKNVHEKIKTPKIPKYRSNARFECYICHTDLSRRECVVRHMQRYHLPSQNHHCLCGGIFATTFNLRDHERKCHFHKQSTSKE